MDISLPASEKQGVPDSEPTDGSGVPMRSQVAVSSYSSSVQHYMDHVALHQQWSAAKDLPGYDKCAWMARDNALHSGCRGGCLKNPPPLPEVK